MTVLDFTSHSSHSLLRAYVEAVLNAPHSLHLTSARDAGEFWERHVLDALQLLALLPSEVHRAPHQVLDVGSGNGIPGLVLAIAAPPWHVTLLDSDSTKCGFLDTFCKYMNIRNVTVAVGRAEMLAHTPCRESYDLVFARALSKLPVALELATPFMKLTGTLIVSHGTSFEKQLDASKKAMKELDVRIQDIKPYKVTPTLTFQALFFKKMGQTPEKYPRKVGTPAKRPL